MLSAPFRTVTVGVAAIGLIVSGYFFTRVVARSHAVPPLAFRAPAAQYTAEEEKHLAIHYNDVLVSLDELLVNVNSRSPDQNHTVSLKLELELFSESEKSTLEQRIPGITDKVLEITQGQEFERLGTTAGKLYLKELLVSGLNGYLRQPLVRDVHFSAFYLH